MRSWFWILVAMVAFVLSIVALVEFSLLQPRLSSIQATVNSQQKMLKELSDKVATIPENVTDLGVRIGSLEEAQQGLAQELATQKSLVDELKLELSKSEDSVYELFQKLNTFMSKEEIQAYFEQYNQKASALENTLSNLSQKVDEVSVFSSNLDQRVEELEKTFTQASSEFRQEFQQKVNLLYRNLQGISERLRTLQSQLEELQNTLAHLPERFMSKEEGEGLQSLFEKRIGELQAWFAEIEKDLESLAAQVTELTNKFNSLQSTVTQGEEAVKQLMNKVSDLTKSTEELFVRLENSSGSLSEVRQIVEDLVQKAAQLSTLQLDLEKLYGQVAGLDLDQRLAALLNYSKREVNKLNEKLGDLEQRVASQEEAMLLKEKLLASREEFESALSSLSQAFEEVKISTTQASSEFRQEFQQKVNLLYRNLQGISERLRTLQSQLEELQNTLAHLPERFMSKEEGEGLQEKLGEFKNGLDELSRTLSGLAQEWVEYQKESAQKVEERFLELKTWGEELIGVLQEEMTKFSERLRELEQGFVYETENLNSLLGKYQQLLQELDVLKQSLPRLEDNVEQLRMAVAQEGEEWQKKFEELLNSTKGEIEKILAVLPDEARLKELEQTVTNLVEQELSVKEELANLKSQLTSLLGQWQEESEIIEELKKQLAGFAQEKVSEGEIEQIVSEIGQLAATREAFEARLKELDQKVKSLEEQWSILDAERIGESLSVLQKEVEKLSGSLDDVFQKLSQIPDQEIVQQLSSTLEEAFTQLEALRTFVQDTLRQEIQVRTEAVEKKVAQLSEEMLSALRDAQVSSQELETIKGALEELSASKKILEEKVNQILGTLESEEAIGNIQEDLAALNRQKEALRAEIARLAEERSNIDQRLQEKIQERERIEREIEELKETKGSLEEIARLEEERNQAQVAIDALQKELTHKDQQIEKLQRENERLTALLEESKKYTSYVILPWDNLWNIARRYYRDGRKWKIILEANKEVITDPLKLQPYTEIKVPRFPNSDP